MVGLTESTRTLLAKKRRVLTKRRYEKRESDITYDDIKCEGERSSLAKRLREEGV